MSFLSAVAAKIVQWLLEKGAVLFYAIARFEWAKFWSRKKTKEVTDNLEKAETPDELKKANDDIADNFNTKRL